MKISHVVFRYFGLDKFPVMQIDDVWRYLIFSKTSERFYFGFSGSVEFIYFTLEIP